MICAMILSSTLVFAFFVHFQVLLHCSHIQTLDEILQLVCPFWSPNSLRTKSLIPKDLTMLLKNVFNNLPVSSAHFTFLHLLANLFKLFIHCFFGSKPLLEQKKWNLPFLFLVVPWKQWFVWIFYHSIIQHQCELNLWFVLNIFLVFPCCIDL